jgi:hypothetical protein
MADAPVLEQWMRAKGEFAGLKMATGFKQFCAREAERFNGLGSESDMADAFNEWYHGKKKPAEKPAAKTAAKQAAPAATKAKQ